MKDQKVMFLPHILEQQLGVLCGADRAVLDSELDLFLPDDQIIPFPRPAHSEEADPTEKKAA